MSDEQRDALARAQWIDKIFELQAMGFIVVLR